MPTTKNALPTADTSSDNKYNGLCEADGAGKERAYNHRVSTRRFSSEPDGAGRSRAYSHFSHLIARTRAE